MVRDSIAGIIALAAMAAPMSVAVAQVAVVRAQTAVPAFATPRNVAPGVVVVRCESFGFRSATCAAASSGDVTVGRVLGGRCIPGITWFYDRYAIHVRAGCRAIFFVGRAIPGWVRRPQS